MSAEQTTSSIEPAFHLQMKLAHNVCQFASHYLPVARMGCTGSTLVLLTAAFAFFAYKFSQLLATQQPPVLDEPYWGPGEPVNDDPTIKPFTINFTDQMITDLKHRLANHRPITPALEDSKQHYGLNSKLVTEIIDFWRNDYDFKAREKFLNKFPQYQTQVQGLDIHYIHVKPQQAADVKVLPLLLLHGWPGSIREFYDVIPILTTKQKGRDFVFEVIVPSLPGYGFSQGASKKGLATSQAAVILKNLMLKLGFEQWYLQGGDWGSFVILEMAVLFPNNILGAHSNFCFSTSPIAHIKTLLGAIYPPLVVSEKQRHRMYPLSKMFHTYLVELGYMHIQATKPDQVGIGLNDSPVGLAAYILNLFVTWTNMEYKSREDGGLKLKFKYEDLLDNIMIYWVSNSITTSQRLYAETLSRAHMALQIDRCPIKVPVACASFAHEFFYQSPYVMSDKFPNMVQNNHFDVGGHFAALEEPELLAEDIYEAIPKFQAAQRL